MNLPLSKGGTVVAPLRRVALLIDRALPAALVTVVDEKDRGIAAPEMLLTIIEIYKGNPLFTSWQKV